MDWRSSCAALAATVLLMAAGPAGAQQRRGPAIPPDLSAAEPDRDDRLGPVPDPAVRTRMFHVVPISENIEFGLGRYAVPEIARPRTHMETDRSPTDVRRRGRGITGVGFKLSF
jgi:hypothetical protein